MINKTMERLKKPFEPITTLVIIYLGLITVSIALYALIQIYVDDKATASNLLSWTATLFATIALLYTFNSWREQKGSEVSSNISTKIYISFDKVTTMIQDLDVLIYTLIDELKEEDKSKIYDIFDKLVKISDKNSEIFSLIDIIIDYKSNLTLKNEVEEYEKNIADLSFFIEELEEINEKWDISDQFLKYNSHKDLEDIILEINESIKNIKELLLPYIYHKY